MFQQMEGRLGLKERDGRDKLLDLFCVEERRRGGGGLNTRRWLWEYSKFKPCYIFDGDSMSITTLFCFWSRLI